MAVLVASTAPQATAGAAPRNAADAGSTLSGLYSGSYTVGDFGGALNLYVAPNGQSIEDVSANVTMTCSPGAAAFRFIRDRLAGPSRQRNVHNDEHPARRLSWQPGHGHLQFPGQVDDPGPVGCSRDGRLLTATMTYTVSGTTYSCTSNKLPWTTTRETQPTPQPTTPPPSGLYPGSYTVGDFGGALNLYVAPNGQSIEDVSANVAMTCSPGAGSLPLHS